MQSHHEELAIDLSCESSINVSRIGCLKGEPIKINCAPLETGNSDNAFIDADEFHIRSYVSVRIDGLPEQRALVDSGSEICCINRDLVQHLNLPIIKQIRISGLRSQFNVVDVVRLHLKTPISNDDGHIVNIAPTIRVWFAIVPELNESVILTPNVVTLLNDIARYDIISPNLRDSEVNCEGLIQKELATADENDNVDSADDSHADKDCGGNQILVVNRAEANTIKPLDNNETEYFDTEQTQTVQNERVADRATLSAEQKRCPSLQHSWALASSNKGNFFFLY